jgi:serine phosphatase RsbU (regulator of sigma subunit)
VQQALVQPLPQRLVPLRIAALYLPASDRTHVGGDLFTAARVGHGTRLIIGDVRGRGLTAIDDSAHLLKTFREQAHRLEELPALAAVLEVGFSRHLAATDREVGEWFATALLLDLPDTDPVIRITNCGHPPPLLLHKRRVYSLDVPQLAPPLGVCELPDVRSSSGTFAFEPGDTLLLYTDGVTQARDRSLACYPLSDRIAAWSTAGPGSLLRNLSRDLLDHTDERLRDDAALIAIRRMPARLSRFLGECHENSALSHIRW